MTPEQFAAAKPLDQDITILNAILPDIFPDPAPGTVGVSDIATICSRISGFIDGTSGDARIIDALNAASLDYYNALKAAIANVQSVLSADFEAL